MVEGADVGKHSVSARKATAADSVARSTVAKVLHPCGEE